MEKWEKLYLVSLEEWKKQYLPKGKHLSLEQEQLISRALEEGFGYDLRRARSI
jgi:hypothetical protein